MRRLARRCLWAIAAVGAAASLGGCVDKTVYRDNPVFRAPPSAAEGFLGYSREADKQTVCGNCHTGQQTRWETTKHADAFATLANSGSMQGFCQACHTVNERGSGTATDTVGGFVATNDVRYHDVQCENCHGPGLDHVENPDASQPLASIRVTTGPQGTGANVGCAECHNGVHHPFVEEWKQSGHGTMATSWPAGPQTRAECQGCHTAQGALVAWGVDAAYKERDSLTTATKAPLTITCAVCHDPHGRQAGATPTEHQLRYSISVPDEEQNLCIKCHHKRAQPDIDPITKNSRGPHSPEGPLLLGENVGFWFGNMPYDGARIVATHGTEANPTLCARCHVDRFPVTDKLTGKFLFQATGHLFVAIPCLDANGLPTTQTDCAVTARTFKACAGTGCHGTPDAARSAWVSTKSDIELLAAEVKRLVDIVRATEVKSNDGKWTTAEGADFNYQLALKPGSEVHNPFLIRALLAASITQMKKDYGLTVSAQVVDMNFTKYLEK